MADVLYFLEPDWCSIREVRKKTQIRNASGKWHGKVKWTRKLPRASRKHQSVLRPSVKKGVWGKELDVCATSKPYG